MNRTTVASTRVFGSTRVAVKFMQSHERTAVLDVELPFVEHRFSGFFWRAFVGQLLRRGVVHVAESLL